MDNSCPLCGSIHTESYYINDGSTYLQCKHCSLVFLTKEYHLKDTDEKLRYDQHNNDPKDENYRKFLSKVFNPIISYIKPNTKGLDFGCGPGPTLSLMFEESGFKVDIFDKYYANNQDIFNNKYDFITATEVVEHLHNPGFEIERLFSMLNKDGVLGVMTKMLDDSVDFASWYYKDDPTHICFYSKNTMTYLARKYKAKVDIIGDVTLFYK